MEQNDEYPLSPPGSPGPTREFRDRQIPRTLSEWVVEQCLSYRVGDEEPPIPGMPKMPTFRNGSRNRRYFKCPKCHRLVQNLYLPPTKVGDNGASNFEVTGFKVEGKLVVLAHFRCRWCWSLRYASQRFGRSHPIRRRLSPRKEHHEANGLPPYFRWDTRRKTAEKWLNRPVPTDPYDKVKWANANIDAALAMGRKGCKW